MLEKLSRKNLGKDGAPQVNESSPPISTSEKNLLLMCPQCGKVSRVDETGLGKCGCGGRLLFKKSYLSEMYANRTLFDECLNFSDELERDSGLDFLSHIRLDLSRYSRHEVARDRDFLNTQYKHTGESETDFVIESIRRKLKDKKKFLSTIIGIDDAAWRITKKEEGTSDEQIRATVFFAHPNGSYTALTISSQRFDADPRKLNFKIDIRRFDNYPKTDKDLVVILDEDYQVRVPKSWETSSIGELKFDTQYGPTKISQTSIEKELIEELDNLENAFSVAIIEKFNRVASVNSDKKVLNDSPKISEDYLKDEEKTAFIDKSPEEGTALSCSNCGALFGGYEGQPSFLRCENCSTINDFIEQDRFSPEMLQIRQASETFIPADYFLYLLQEVEDDGGPKRESVLEALSFSGSDLPDEQQLIFANAISRIAAKHPYLLTFYNDDDDHFGGVMNIEFPNKVSIESSMAMKSFNYDKFGIPQDLKGKVLSVTFGDFDGNRATSFKRWCKVATTIFNIEGFNTRFGGDGKSPIASWAEEHFLSDKQETENHWAEYWQLTIEDGLSDLEAGLIYNQIEFAVDHIPPRNSWLGSKAY